MRTDNDIESYDEIDDLPVNNIQDKLNKSCVELFTDGSCLGNPGKGGIGYIIIYETNTEPNGIINTSEIVGSQGFENTTNNRMELYAAITGITKILEKISDETISKPDGIILSTDSKYIADAINQKWITKWNKNKWQTSNNKSVKNQDLWKKFDSLINIDLKSKDIELSVNHIYGHDGHEYNERCDKLAKNAAYNEELSLDSGYGNKWL